MTTSVVSTMLIKLESWATAVAETRCERDVEEPAARLAAEVALAVFRTAFEGWTGEAAGRTLPEFIRESLDQLTTLATAGSSQRRGRTRVARA
jgi:transcriptional regulator MftR-like protein